MPGYLGDQSRRIIHRADGVLPRCMGDSTDVRDLIDIHSEELRAHLQRSERWLACPRCVDGRP